LEQTLSKTSILAVDDNADTLELMAELLLSCGATVRTATDAEQALEIVGTWTPDVLLIDIGLPRMDGYELLAALRCRLALRDVPAVAVTGYAYDGALSNAAGFDAFVVKPFDGEVLIALLSRLRRERP
jgi:CheY-like chemotaxis protein